MDQPVASSSISRRKFLVGTGSIVAAGALGPALSRAKSPSDPFTLGVASGDPLPDGVVLWSRLAPDPLNGGGMPSRDVTVQWQVAADEGFRHIIKKGTATARPQWAHSVHVEVEGLKPSSWYWYRFRAGSEISPVGRTKTAPEQTASPDRFRFAFASCQQYEHGYYTAYRHMANEDLDLVCHLGDYIYEYGPDEYVAPGGNVRHHPAPEVMTLTDYRNRYALYKSDPDLQSAHAAFPWAFTWDDHEVENDYADEESENGDPDRRFLRRRANAYRACWEHMPLRSSRPRGSDLRLYQRLRFGDLVEMSVLDTRQYRSDQACARVTGEFVGGGQAVDNCPALFDEDRTMLGPRQERWVLDGLGRSKARWNVIAQQLLMAYLDEKPGPGVSFWTDGWDGYQPARARILGYLHRRQISNPIVIGGDIHSFWATDLKADFRNEDSATVASEFVGTSITSAGVPQDVFESFLPDNPHIRFFDARLRGYVRCDIDQNRWRTDFQVVDNVRVQSSPLRTLVSFEVEDGRPGVEPA